MVQISQSSLSEAYSPDNGGKSNSTLDIIEEYFYGDWRKRQEFQKVVITQRLYQISPNSTQA